MIRPAHAHVHVVNAGGQPQQQQPSPQAQNIIRQQQELQQQLGNVWKLLVFLKLTVCMCVQR